MKNSDYDPRTDGPHGSGTPGFTCLMVSLLAPMFFVMSGFSSDKTIDKYQRYGNEFTCPFQKDGSCSEAFRNDGFKALICKCHETRKAAKS